MQLCSTTYYLKFLVKLAKASVRISSYGFRFGRNYWTDGKSIEFGTIIPEFFPRASLDGTNCPINVRIRDRRPLRRGIRRKADG